MKGNFYLSLTEPLYKESDDARKHNLGNSTALGTFSPALHQHLGEGRRYYHFTYCGRN